MPTLTLKEAVAQQEAAQINYRHAVTEYRAAFARLRALDMLLSRGGYHLGFGEPPSAVSLRHAIAAPHEGGSLDQDAARVFSTLSLVEEVTP